jgi:hypothetical protein
MARIWACAGKAPDVVVALGKVRTALRLMPGFPLVVNDRLEAEAVRLERQ